MDSNTNLKRPDWLTEERIHELLQILEECDNPYTDQEIADFALDDGLDIYTLECKNAPDPKRMDANFAVHALKEYGLLPDTKQFKI